MIALNKEQFLFNLTFNINMCEMSVIYIILNFNIQNTLI